MKHPWTDPFLKAFVADDPVAEFDRLVNGAEKKPQRALFAEPNQDGSYPYGEMRYTVRELGSAGEWTVIARGLTLGEAERLP